MHDHDLRAVINKVSLAVELEEARAVELSLMADQAMGSPIAEHLRSMARERRIRCLEMQARLTALLAAADKTRGE